MGAESSGPLYFQPVSYSSWQISFGKEPDHRATVAVELLKSFWKCGGVQIEVETDRWGQCTRVPVRNDNNAANEKAG